MRTLISEKLRDVLLNKKATLELYENLIDKHKQMQPFSSNTPSSYGRVIVESGIRQVKLGGVFC